MKLLKNKARCLNCLVVIQSYHRHDFVVCKCFRNTEDTTGIFIDGGNEYQRRGGNQKNFEDLSEYGDA
jgi:hypothetical protein